MRPAPKPPPPAPRPSRTSRTTCAPDCAKDAHCGFLTSVPPMGAEQAKLRGGAGRGKRGPDEKRATANVDVCSRERVRKETRPRTPQLRPAELGLATCR